MVVRTCNLLSLVFYLMVFYQTFYVQLSVLNLKKSIENHVSLQNTHFTLRQYNLEWLYLVREGINNSRMPRQNQDIDFILNPQRFFDLFDMFIFGRICALRSVFVIIIATTSFHIITRSRRKVNALLLHSSRRGYNFVWNSCQLCSFLCFPIPIWQMKSSYHYTSSHLLLLKFLSVLESRFINPWAI